MELWSRLDGKEPVMEFENCQYLECAKRLGIFYLSQTSQNA